MRNLQDLLTSDFGLGSSLAGWTLRSAEGVSADGRTIVGLGTNPSGNDEAWLARSGPAASPIPEPTSLVVFGIVAISFFGLLGLGPQCRGVGGQRRGRAGG